MAYWAFQEFEHQSQVTEQKPLGQERQQGGERFSARGTERAGIRAGPGAVPRGPSREALCGPAGCGWGDRLVCDLPDCTIAESGPDDTSGGRKQKETPLVGRHEMRCPEIGGSTTTTPKKRRWVVVVGDALLRGTESSICRPDRENREVCCLPGAKIRNVMERLPRLKPSDRYPFLLLHVGTNDTAKNDLEQITADYVALGRRIKELEAQAVFSSILPVEGKGRDRDRRIVEVNEWLRRWCRREGFGFFDHGMVFHEGGVLGRDGLHLTKRGKSIFASRLANLVRRALN
ncbi:uncharacterized protein [Lepidochelys kempii]|uniref:uncharacterized protein n=1 Tax=Lepidochelys kempii TaxID=8472 RepID=UPI003C700B70